MRSSAVTDEFAYVDSQSDLRLMHRRRFVERIHLWMPASLAPDIAASAASSKPSIEFAVSGCVAMPIC
ncbi:hypothetical protein AWB74_07606 [Caballeronia arvi]|uniref:Uncharacterized protein n=2 Tax=Caballeronia arvi TaxID=1777135 RepID=A0A158KYK7_9BURK|nr:hypothetical protein AWB74_07606 [Caballeronia arvi]